MGIHQYVPDSFGKLGYFLSEQLGIVQRMACSVVQNRIQQLLGRFTWIVFQIQPYIEPTLPFANNKIRSQCSQADLRSHILDESQGFRSVFKRSFSIESSFLHVESLLSPLFVPFPQPVPPRPDTARCHYFCKDISIHRMRRICRICRIRRMLGYIGYAAPAAGTASRSAGASPPAAFMQTMTKAKKFAVLPEKDKEAFVRDGRKRARLRAAFVIPRLLVDVPKRTRKTVGNGAALKAKIQLHTVCARFVTGNRFGRRGFYKGLYGT